MGGMSFMCEVCGKWFLSRRALKDHSRDAHREQAREQRREGLARILEDISRGGLGCPRGLPAGRAAPPLVAAQSATPPGGGRRKQISPCVPAPCHGTPARRKMASQAPARVAERQTHGSQKPRPFKGIRVQVPSRASPGIGLKTPCASLPTPGSSRNGADFLGFLTRSPPSQGFPAMGTL